MTIVSHRRRFIFVKPRKTAGSSVQIALAPWCGEGDVLSDGGLVFRPGVDTDDFRAPPVRHAGWNDRYGHVAQHALPDVVRAKVGARVWDDYFKFTVARNPWDLFVSMYHHDLRVILPEIGAWTGRRLRGLLGRRGRARSLRTLRRALGPERGRLRHSARLRRLLVSLPDLFWRSRLVRDLENGRRKESVEFALRTGCFARHVAEIPQFYFCGGREYADYVVRFEHLQQDFAELRRRLGIPGARLPRTRSEVRPGADDYRTYYTDWSRAHVARRCRPMIDAFGYRFDEPPAA